MTCVRAAMCSQAPLRVLSHMHSFSHAQLCSVLRSLTRLGVGLADDWLAAVGARMGHMLACMEASAAAECLVAEGCMVLPEEEDA